VTLFQFISRNVPGENEDNHEGPRNFQASGVDLNS
jgi:hypothetical protein